MIQYRPRAVESVVECGVFIAQDSPASAERFLARVEETLGVLERMPRMGRPWPRPPRPLKGLRVLAVTGFPNHLVFYMPAPGGIVFVDLIHGSRDIGAVLDG